jgi:hypothetical protein
LEVSLPERTYDVAALLLAAALVEAESTGDSPMKTLARHATHYGKSIGQAARQEVEPGSGSEVESGGSGSGAESDGSRSGTGVESAVAGTGVESGGAGYGVGSRSLVLGVLAGQGFEPREVEGDILLGNCPFRVLAKEHPELVCGMNRHLLGGLLDGLGDTEREAVISPSAGHCCVRISRRAG